MKWLFSLPAWARYAAIAAVFVPIASCILCLNCIANKNEPVWANVSAQWDAPPIRVWSDDFPEATRAAFEVWNNAADCDVFVYAESEDDSDIVVMSTNGTPCGEMNAPEIEDHNTAGASYRYGRCAEVHLLQPGSSIRHHLITIAHELGHMVDLAHDPDPCVSVMGASLEAIFECPIVVSSRRDGEALRRRYCE